MMKIGASTYSLSKAIRAGAFDVLGAFDWLADSGADHIEIVPLAEFSFETSPELAEVFAERARSTGLEISCYTFGASFIDRNEEEFQAELSRVRAQVDIAGRLGTSLVRHDVAFRPAEEATDARFEADLPHLVRACQEIADYAASLGITTMIENHGLHVQGADRVLRILHGVNRANFRLLVDTGNFLPVEFDHTLEAIVRCAPFAGMVHVKDHHIVSSTPADPENWRDRGRGYFSQVAVACEGDIGIPSAIQALREAGFDGYLSLEYEGPEDAVSANLRGMDNLRRLIAAA